MDLVGLASPMRCDIQNIYILIGEKIGFEHESDKNKSTLWLLTNVIKAISTFLCLSFVVRSFIKNIFIEWLPFINL